jgi:DNA invertase Pin-like site-specific DNA recombinase
MANLIFYKRVSTSEQGDSRLGLDAQQADLERFARNGGHTIIDSMEEVVSGKYDLDRRPVLKKALQRAAKDGCIVVVSKLDRLSRKASFILSLMDTKAPFASAEDGLECPPLQLHVRAIIAEDERRRIGERTKAALAQVKARGIKLGGIVKNHDVGIQKGAATNKAEADAFAEFLKPVLKRMRDVGMSVNQIAQELNEQGTKTARGGKWYPTTVLNVMRRW